MAYNKDELEEQALKIIKDKGVPFVSHLVTYLPCSEATFYNLELDKLESIKGAINKERVNKKAKMLSWMATSENATATIACYKLMSDPTELALLNSQQIDHTSKGVKITGFSIVEPSEDSP